MKIESRTWTSIDYLSTARFFSNAGDKEFNEKTHKSTIELFVKFKFWVLWMPKLVFSFEQLYKRPFDDKNNFIAIKQNKSQQWNP